MAGTVHEVENHALLAEVERRGAGMVFVSQSPALTARIATRVVELG